MLFEEARSSTYSGPTADNDWAEIIERESIEDAQDPPKETPGQTGVTTKQ